MLIKQRTPFPRGYTAITEEDGKHSEMMMDFGILIQESGDREESRDPKERAFLLMNGKAEISWGGESRVIERNSVLDENPWVLHVPAGTAVSLQALRDGTEWAVQKRSNDKAFEAKLYTQEECLSQHFGAGTMQETSTRTVRTVFDSSNAPWSRMVIGEVINHPGKWSSYPPHHHAQPEIYHFRILPEQGFGFSSQGEDVYKVYNRDTVTILPDIVHPQTAAPGYAMYYIWMIPHLEHDQFGPDSRIFTDEHKWLQDPDAAIWSPRS